MSKRTFLCATALLAVIAGGCASSSKTDEQRQSGMLGGAADSNLKQPMVMEKDPPLRAETHFAAGQFAEAQGNFAVAATQYEKACALKQDYLLAEYRLGVCYSRMKNWEKAIPAWKNYIESTNGDTTAYSNLGFTYELAGDPQHAEEAYKLGIARNPKAQPCRVNYGLLLARTDRIQEAVAQFQEVLSPAQVHYNLASVYEQQGRTKLARDEYEMAVRLDPKLTDARSRLATLGLEDIEQ
jgi:tetratricopeptide (TPR) repeat protein